MDTVGGERAAHRVCVCVCVCGESNVWNPNCVTAPEQTLVLPVVPQAARGCVDASVEGDNSMSPADKESP